jgi:hypothetical protein
MADIKRDARLRTIFSFFLGLMLTAFVGVGVSGGSSLQTRRSPDFLS